MFKVLTMNDEIREDLNIADAFNRGLVAGDYVVRLVDNHTVGIYHNTIVEKDRTLLDAHEIRLVKDNGYKLIPFNPVCHNKENALTVVSFRPDIEDYDTLGIMYNDSFECRKRKLDLEKINAYLGDISNDDKAILKFIVDGRHLINKKHNRYYQPVTIVLECTNGYEGQFKVIYTRSGMLFSRELKEFIAKFRIGENDKECGL